MRWHLNISIFSFAFQDILNQQENNIPMKILLENVMVNKKISLRQVSLLTGVPKSPIDDIVDGRKSPRLATM